MSRPNSTGSFYTSKVFSSSLGSRSSPSSLHSTGGVSTFIHHPPTPFQRSSASRPSDLRDQASSEEPEEGGGVGVRYEPQNHQQREEYEHAASSPLGKQEEEDYEEEDSIISRSSTPRQVRYPLVNSASLLKAQNAPGQVLRIPDLQQIFNNEEYDVFEDDDTPPFSETTVTIPNKVLDSMRLPLPAPGQAVMDPPAPWGKMSRERSDDSEIVEIKQEAFHAQQDSGGVVTGGKTGFDKVANTEMRLEVAAWNGGDDEEEERREGSELPNGYEQECDKASYGEGPLGEEEDGMEYYNAEYSDGNEGSDYDEQKDEPGIWSEGSPPISSRGWLGHRRKESLENVPPQKQLREPYFHGNGKGKGKAKGKHPDKGHDNDAQRSEFRSQKPNILPLAVRSNRPSSDTTTREDVELSPRSRAEMTVQATGHGVSNKEVAVVPERKRGNKDQSRRVVAAPSNDIDLTVLLSDSELSSIPNYADLLIHLTTLRSSAHTIIPSTQLPSELDELAKSYYPHNPRKPEKFFNKLDDKQHALAGEYILSKKRELEEQLAGVVAKRRRVCESMRAEVERVAEVRVMKLKRTEERREMLKGGVGKMLREAGLWL